MHLPHNHTHIVLFVIAGLFSFFGSITLAGFCWYLGKEMFETVHGYMLVSTERRANEKKVIQGAIFACEEEARKRKEN